ncbi:MAG: NAD(+)/NADH kinase, partial [Candidatus Eisenbacteria bacterium]|nr:NAD(+)/NADH kinase [Candidatus Eisenbacteria bacterium]
MKRALVIVNPTAGQRTPEDTRSEIEEAATEHAEWRCEIRETTGPGDAARWAGEAAAEGFDRVIAVGGDGTVTEAAAGLLEAGSDLPLAAIPVGTANVLGEVLRVPSDLGEAVAVALTGEARDFDIGHLPEHDRYFLIGIGIGIPGKTVENADRTAKDRFGFAAYVFAFLEGLAENRSAVIDSTIDGEPHIASGQSVI